MTLYIGQRLDFSNYYGSGNYLVDALREPEQNVYNILQNDSYYFAYLLDYDAVIAGMKLELLHGIVNEHNIVTEWSSQQWKSVYL